MKRKHLALLAFLLSQSTSLWGMDEENELVPNRVVRTLKDKETNIATGIFYKVKNKEFLDGFGLEVDSRGTDNKIDSSGTRWVTYGRSGNYNHPTDWTLIPSSNGFYKVKNREFLDGYGLEVDSRGTDNKIDSSGTRWMTYGRSGNYDHPTDWIFIPAAYKLKAVIQDFQYQLVEDLNSLATTSISAVAWTMENQSYDMSLIAHPNIHQSKQNENYWSFTESHERNFFNRIDVGVSAGYFGVNAHVNNTTEWTNNDKTLEETVKRNVDTTDVDMVSDITIPPRKRVNYNITWKEIDADIPFTATVKINGFADRLKKNGSVANMVQVDVDGVMALLRYAGYTGQLIGQEGKFALARIKGTLKAKGAINGQLTMSSTNI